MILSVFKALKPDPSLAVLGMLRDCVRSGRQRIVILRPGLWPKDLDLILRVFKALKPGPSLAVLGMLRDRFAQDDKPLVSS